MTSLRPNLARTLRRVANRLDPRKPIRVSFDWEGMNRTYAAGMRNIEASEAYARARYGRPQSSSTDA